MQRMMWGCGCLVSYVSPKVDQIRNVHDFRADLDAEDHLYKRTESLLEALALSDWKNFEAFTDLWIGMYEHAFVEREDVELAIQWHDTVQKLLSEEDKTCKQPVTIAEKPPPAVPVAYVPQQDNGSGCAVPRKYNVALFVMWNWHIDAEVSKLITDTFDKWIAGGIYHIGGSNVECNSQKSKDGGKGKNTGGRTMYKCYLEAIENYLRTSSTQVEGFMFMGDDVAWYPPHFFEGKDLSHVWSLGRVNSSAGSLDDTSWQKNWPHWKSKDGVPAIKRTLPHVPQPYLDRMHQRLGCTNCIPLNAISDILYLPNNTQLLQEFTELVDIFYKEPVFHEAGLPAMLHMLTMGAGRTITPQHFYWMYWDWSYWGSRREEDALNAMINGLNGFIHPVKLKRPQTKEIWEKYLKHFMCGDNLPTVTIGPGGFRTKERRFVQLVKDTTNDFRAKAR